MKKFLSNFFAFTAVSVALLATSHVYAMAEQTTRLVL
jgi:hypothetical protein